MVEPLTINIRHLAQDVRLPQEQVQSAVDLLDAGMPVPFIARYRKEVTNNLDEESLRQIDEELRLTRVLCERKLTILKTIESAGKLTPELDQTIREAKSMKRLEDVYLPFRPKRHHLAVAARENGIEPFALEMFEGTLPLDQVDNRAAEFFNADKKITTVADVLLGAGHLIADRFSCNAELVHRVRDLFYQHGTLTAAKIESAAEKKVESPAETMSQTESQTESANAAEQTAAETIPAETMPEADQPGVMTVSPLPEKTESQEEEAAPAETTALPETETVEDPALSADESQEVTQLFEQLKEEQAEKGMPVVLSQNSIKKKKRAEAKKRLEEIKQRQREHFERQFTEYFQFSTKLRGIPTHRILALDRGERHRILHVALHIDEQKMLESLKELCIPKDHIHTEFLTECLRDALRRSVLPMLTKEIRSDMTEYAEKNVIRSFSKNLRNMLMQPPLVNKRVLAIEPGNKNAYIAAALDEFGNLLAHESIVLLGSAERKDKAVKTLAEMIRRYQLSVIALSSGGNPIAEETTASMIETQFADSDLSYVMVNKSGLMSYAASAAAKAELPQQDLFVRAAVSLGRRLQNSLEELVKADPATLGIGIFHLDSRGNYLKKMLADVLDSCVNSIGVDVNKAAPMLLNHVAGLNPMTARRICEYRREHGHFQNREDLKKVPGISETVYTQAAGFLRIEGGTNPLDATNIHPESYELAGHVLEKIGFTPNDLRCRETVKAVRDKILSEKVGELTNRLSSELGSSAPAVRDILENLLNPGRDPRAGQPPLIFRKTVLKLESLSPGMELIGTILNVTDFGAFVDIGLRESGFIHVSQMSTGYIRNAHDRVIAGDMLRMWVVEADAGKKRVSLTLLPPGTVKHTPPHRSEEQEQSRPPREHATRPNRDPSRGHRESSERQRDAGRESREGKRFDRQHAGGRTFDRSPKTFVSAPVKKEIKPITEKMKQGKEPMRSFSDLAQLMGRTQVESEDQKKGKK